MASPSKAGKTAGAIGGIKVERVLTAATVIIVLAAWAIVSNAEIFPSALLPTPQAVWSSFVDMLQNGYKGSTLLEHLGASMERLLIAYVLAVVTAVPLGLIAGFNGKVRAVIEPIVEFYRPLPPLAYYTLLVLWMGIQNESKITLLFLAAFAPIFVSCVSAVSRVKEDYLLSAYTVGANKGQVFAHVIFPACLPDMFTGMRTAMGTAYATLVAAEMVAATSGLGWLVLDASNYLRTDIVFVGIIIMGITGILLDLVLRFLEARAIPWKGKD